MKQGPIKIPRELKDVSESEPAVIVCGKKEADLYLIQRGEISRIEGFKLSKPGFTDNESFFRTGGQGRTYGSGAVREAPKQKEVSDFLKELDAMISRNLKSLQNRELKVFGPQYLKNEILKCIKKLVAKQEIAFFEGNYLKAHPLELIKKIINDNDNKERSQNGRAEKGLNQQQE